MHKIAAAKLLLKRARIEDPSIPQATRRGLYEAAALMFPEDSPERHSAEHNAFLLKEAERHQLAFQDMIDPTDQI